MATGIQTTESKLNYTVRLVEGATSAAGAPSGLPVAVPAAGQGFAMAALGSGYTVGPEVTVWTYSTAGSGTMSIAASRVWVFHYTSSTAGVWVLPGTGTALTVGYLNEGGAYDETSANQISRVETLYLPAHYDGIYVDLGAISGTATAVNVDIKFARHTVK